LGVSAYMLGVSCMLGVSAYMLGVSS
jgi:hypothetical protein